MALLPNNELVDLQEESKGLSTMICYLLPIHQSVPHTVTVAVDDRHTLVPLFNTLLSQSMDISVGGDVVCVLSDLLALR